LFREPTFERKPARMKTKQAARNK